MELGQVFQGLAFIVLGVGAMVLYFWGSNWALDEILADPLGPNGDPIKSRENQREAIRPWLFVAPALIILAIYLVVPTIQTFYYSFADADGNVNVNVPVYPEEVRELNINTATPLNAERMLDVRDVLLDDYPQLESVTLEDIESANLTTNGDGINFLFDQAEVDLEQRFVLLRNYQWAFDPGNEDFWVSVRNSILWLLVPAMSTVFGLLIAILADDVRWGTLPKTLIFLPMAISFIGASVIWRFIYYYKGQDVEQIGLLNAIIVSLGGEAQAWMTIEPWNNLLLMIILIWIQTGFAMVLLSAALRGVPEETKEAARIDGANEVRIFFNVIVPQIMSTILVVFTTITIVVLKVFDIVQAMTNGQNGTQVLANLMFNQSFRNFDVGRGAIVSVVLLFAVVPILVWNLRQFREQEQTR
jgi:alpha-glucoside transport system permease protein